MSERLTEANLVRVDALIERGIRFQPASAADLVAEIRLSWQERNQERHAVDVWKAHYQDLVQEPLPRLLYRRLLVGVARMMGGKRTT